MLALPLTAILTLDATPAQLGILTAAATLPSLLVSLPAGAWVDRLRRRPVLIGADLGRALLLGSIPLAAVLGLLRIEYLYLVAALASALTVFFNVAADSYLPALIPRRQLVEGNSKLAASESLAQIAGPGVGGVLVQLITAPLAILVDAGSFLVSALCLRFIRTAEPAPPTGDQEQRIWHEIGEGLRLLAREPVLRAFAGCSGTLNGFGGIGDALFRLYALRHLAMSPALLGTIYALGSVAWLFGAVLVNRVTLRLGPGPTMLLGALLIGVANLLVPLAGVLLEAALPLLAGLPILAPGDCQSPLQRHQHQHAASADTAAAAWARQCEHGVHRRGHVAAGGTGRRYTRRGARRVECAADRRPWWTARGALAVALAGTQSPVTAPHPPAPSPSPSDREGSAAEAGCCRGNHKGCPPLPYPWDLPGSYSCYVNYTTSRQVSSTER